MIVIAYNVCVNERPLLQDFFARHNADGFDFAIKHRIGNRGYNRNYSLYELKAQQREEKKPSSWTKEGDLSGWNKDVCAMHYFKIHWK